MIIRPRYVFKKELKREFLHGRTIVYLSSTLNLSYSYLSRIIQGNCMIDDFLLSAIMNEIGYTTNEIKALKSRYFYVVNKEEE